MDDADFVAVGSVTEVLETYDSEMVWELEDVERAKRTAWRIFQKCERLASQFHFFFIIIFVKKIK